MTDQISLGKNFFSLNHGTLHSHENCNAGLKYNYHNTSLLQKKKISFDRIISNIFLISKTKNSSIAISRITCCGLEKLCDLFEEFVEHDLEGNVTKFNGPPISSLQIGEITYCYCNQSGSRSEDEETEKIQSLFSST